MKQRDSRLYVFPQPRPPTNPTIGFFGTNSNYTTPTVHRTFTVAGFWHAHDFAQISGNYSLDHARSMELAEMALEYADRFLRPGGNMVVKVFDGDMTHGYVKKIRTKFRVAKRHAPKASRKSSSEIYIIGKGFKG